MHLLAEALASVREGDYPTNVYPAIAEDLVAEVQVVATYLATAEDLVAGVQVVATYFATAGDLVAGVQVVATVVPWG